MHEPPTPPGREWWRAAPDPDLPPITTKRAYAEVLMVFGAFFAAGILAGALLLADRYRDPLSHGSWAAYTPEMVGLVMDIGLAVGVVLLLGERRGIRPADLGLRWPRQDDGRLAVNRTIRIVAWALLALIVGGVINALLQTGHLPLGRSSAPALLFGAFDSLQAGVIEELVVLAFVVVTLRQAGRPWWEVAVVALVLRGSYHIYYGPGVFGILVWAGLYCWLYVRTRQLVPLMVCHAAWDTVGFLGTRWPAVAGVAVLMVIAIWIAAPILWLTERNNRPVGPSPSFPPSLPPALAPPSALPPPGWHPDPAGVNRWRWWDGYRWTDHVSHHSDVS